MKRTLRVCLAIGIAGFLVSFGASQASAQIIPVTCPPICAPPPPPPPPPPAPTPTPSTPASATSSPSVGPYVVGAAMIYVARGIVGTQVIAHQEHRQATLCEFLTWPMHACRRPRGSERRYLKLALEYGNLRSVQERIEFARSGGQSFSWPANERAMRAAIRHERRAYRFNRH